MRSSDPTYCRAGLSDIGSTARTQACKPRQTKSGTVGRGRRSRKLQPSIPLVGERGIPVDDELDLCQVLEIPARQISPYATVERVSPDPLPRS
jgi:hypothetical protein